MKISKIFIFIFIVFVAFLGVYFFNVDYPAGTRGETKIINIEKGDSVSIVGKKLEEEGLIKSAFFFNIYSRINNLSTKIKAGSYELDPSQSIKNICERLVAGEVANREKEIKIIPGWNLDDVGRYLIGNNMVLKSDYEKILSTSLDSWQISIPRPDYLKDAPGRANLEGFIFPDTYRIYNDASIEDILEKILNNLDNKLSSEMREDILKQKKTIYQIMTMASIIEKEVRNAEDMELVSGIFWARVEDGYPLESCATLAYAIGENKKQYSYEDTQIGSPYNTYRNKGLPPGPICNPGLNAIKASIYPKMSDYHYFLNRFDTGETIFSRTYQEHLSNKDKYLK